MLKFSTTIKKNNSPQQVTLFFSPKTPQIQVTQGPDIPSNAAEL